MRSGRAGCQICAARARSLWRGGLRVVKDPSERAAIDDLRFEQALRQRTKGRLKWLGERTEAVRHQLSATRREAGTQEVLEIASSARIPVCCGLAGGSRRGCDDGDRSLFAATAGAISVACRVRTLQAQREDGISRNLERAKRRDVPAGAGERTAHAAQRRTLLGSVTDAPDRVGRTVVLDRQSLTDLNGRHGLHNGPARAARHTVFTKPRWRYHYCASVTVIATEPDLHMLGRARARATVAAATIVLIAADAQMPPFRDRSFDSVVVGLGLCTIPSPPGALAELRRVLRPRGVVRLLEHIRVDRPIIGRLQDALTPAWRRVAGGCRLTERTVETVRQAGFRIDDARLHAGGFVVTIVASVPSAPPEPER